MRINHGLLKGLSVLAMISFAYSLLEAQDSELGRRIYDKGRWTNCIICAIVFSFSAYSTGTEFIVAHHDGTIWIAADSMSISNDSAKRTPTYVCKIFNEGRFYWTVAAVPYDDPLTGFSVAKLVNQIKSTKGTIRDSMNAFIANSKAPIAKEIIHIRKTYPSDFATDFGKFMVHHGKANLIKVVFVGVESGQLVAESVSMTAEEINNHIVVSGTPVELAAEKDWFLGNRNDARDFIDQNRQRIASDPAGLVRDTVLLEERLHPGEVGGPISILQVTDAGGKWIEQGECKQ
jgi:hypothetical protein